MINELLYRIIHGEPSHYYNKYSDKYCYNNFGHYTVDSIFYQKYTEQDLNKLRAVLHSLSSRNNLTADKALEISIKVIGKPIKNKQLISNIKKYYKAIKLGKNNGRI